MSSILTNEEIYIKKLMDYGRSDFSEIRKYGIKNNIPIISDEGLGLLLFLLHIHKPHKILELGTAIGYSGLNMLSKLREASLCTVEISENLAAIARENFIKHSAIDRVRIIVDDAKNALENLRAEGEIFDFVFVDAAKAQYGEYFELTEPLLSPDALVFFDNVFYQGLCCGRRSIRRNNTIRNRMDDFLHKVTSNQGYESSLLGSEGGVLLLGKKNE